VDATVLETRAGRWAAGVNLLLPGGGLILLGAVGSGLLAGTLFIACANFALAAVLLFPDDFSDTTQALGIGLAAGAYVGAQVRVTTQVRRLRAEGTAARRRRALWAARDCLARGDAAAAVDVLRPLVEAEAQDLLVTYQWAQSLTAAGDATRARDAWQQVRRLDRHGIYKQHIPQPGPPKTPS
jgi:hypothetical protein